MLALRNLLLSSFLHRFSFHSSAFVFDLLVQSPLFTLLSCAAGLLFVFLFCCLLKYGLLNQSLYLEVLALLLSFLFASLLVMVALCACSDP